MSAKQVVMIVVLASLFSMMATARADDNQATDYSKPEHWLSLPVVIDKKVDVFYLYPTSWHKVSPDEPGICSIENPTMLAGAKVSYGKQATAFAPVGNVYAPYYRQIDLSPVDREKRVGGIPTQDAVAAFDYYIKHFNRGRPFILAGHSQGSNVLCNLLAGYLKDHPEVYARMIAAYVIGYSVTESYLAANPHLKFAAGPDDTGVIVSYNTEAPDVAAGTNPVTLPGGIAINPITWTRDETPAPAAENMGSIMPAGGVFVPVMNYADARVDKTKGVVICSTADEDKLSPPLAELRGVYHSYDYPFYYYNIRQNAANRVEHFWNKR
jgi:hypothetical protein